MRLGRSSNIKKSLTLNAAVDMPDFTAAFSMSCLRILQFMNDSGEMKKGLVRSQF
jgi:hypothetical protein